MTALPDYLDVPPLRRWLARMESAGQGAAAADRIAAWVAMVEEDGVVRWWRDGKVGWIKLSYPRKGNAYVPPMYGLLTQALTELRDDESVWVIALTGDGKNFSTGGYVGEHAFYAGLDSGEDGTRTEPMRRTFTEMFQVVPRMLYECEKPTVAVVNGLVVGEAIDLMLSADVRIASTTAELWFSAAFGGNTGYSGSAYLLPKIVGLGAAKRLMLTADRIGAREAERHGVISSIHPPDELLSEAQELCERIASLPPVTLRLIKKELNRSYEIGSYDAALDLYACVETIVQTTDDHMNAEEAIANKRTPVVRGY